MNNDGRGPEIVTNAEKIDTDDKSGQNRAGRVARSPEMYMYRTIANGSARFLCDVSVFFFRVNSRVFLFGF